MNKQQKKELENVKIQVVENARIQLEQLKELETLLERAKENLNRIISENE